MAQVTNRVSQSPAVAFIGYGVPTNRRPLQHHLNKSPCSCTSSFPASNLQFSTKAAWLTPPSAALLAAAQGLHSSLSNLDVGKLLGAFVPVTVAMFLSHSLKVGLGKEIQIAIIRSSAQLVSLGLVLKFVFEGERHILSICSVLFMVLIAGQTAGERAKMLPKSHLVATLSIAVGAMGTISLMLLLRVFPMKARFLIPTAGYVIGNSMSMVGTTLNKINHDIRLHKGQIEAALALGASPQEAVKEHVQHAVIQGMGPMVDSIKTAGLISLPGSMTGMLMGGSSPLEAVQMQLQVLYMLFGCASVSSTISSYLGWHMMFSKSQQLLLD